MPEQFLDRAQVGPALEQVRSEGMPECMCCQTPAGRKTETCSFNQPLHIAGIQTASAEADKQRRMTRGVRVSQAQTIAFADIFRHSPSGIFAERNDPLLSAFADHPDELLQHIDVLVIQADQLANAQPARIQQFENRSIAQVLERRTSRQLDNHGRFLLAEIDRQFLRQPRR